MKNIDENFKDILANITGDKVRAAIGSIPGLNVATGVSSIVLNLSELNDDMEKYAELKQEFESGSMDTKNLLDEFEKVED